MQHENAGGKPPAFFFFHFLHTATSWQRRYWHDIPHLGDHIVMRGLRMDSSVEYDATLDWDEPMMGMPQVIASHPTVHSNRLIDHSAIDVATCFTL